MVVGRASTSPHQEPLRQFSTKSGTPPNGLQGIISIAAGNQHTIALLNDGTLRSWGNNAYGQLGIGSFYDAIVPAYIDNVSRIFMVAARSDYSLVLKTK